MHPGQAAQQVQQQDEPQQRHGYMSGLDAVVDVAPASYLKDTEGLDTLADVSVRCCLSRCAVPAASACTACHARLV